MAVIRANPKKTGSNTKRYRIQRSAAAGEALDYVIINENNTEQIVNAMNKAFATALEEIGLKAERFAKKECPVDTGRLRNSITHIIEVAAEVVYIGTNVEYAPYVENGVHGRDGKHFLYHAASNHGEEYRNTIKKHLEGK